MARQGGDRGQSGRRLLGGRARAPGLPGALPQRIHLPLPPAGLEVAATRCCRPVSSASPGPGFRDEHRGLTTVPFFRPTVIAVADTAKPKEPRTAVTNRVSPLGASSHIREMSG